MARGDVVTFPVEQLSGSRLRCMMMTAGSHEQVAARLTELIHPYGRVVAEKPHRHFWMPRGFLKPDEAKLGLSERFVDSNRRRKLLQWWLGKESGRNIPNWDLVAECTVTGRPGLLLVEAKAHVAELNGRQDKSGAGASSLREISRAMGESEAALNGHYPGWNWRLTPLTHYQLCNRFAWSWKLASMGIPVVLVYLGFLHTSEMRDPFDSPEGWRDAVLHYAEGIVPEQAWSEQPIATSKAPFYALIRAMDIDFRVERAKSD
jgi:hypothetical protein